MRWLNNEEIMPPTWRNPMLKIKPPKVNLESLELVSLQDVRALIATCEHGTFSGERDRAVFLFLLDTGARAQEACNVKLDDVNLNTGEVIIQYGERGKSRTVFLGRTAGRAVRAYLRERKDHCPALFVSNRGDHLTYDGLHQLLERRWKRSGIAKRPSMSRYLAQNNTDTQAAHLRGSPVDNGL